MYCAKEEKKHHRTTIVTDFFVTGLSTKNQYLMRGCLSSVTTTDKSANKREVVGMSSWTAQYRALDVWKRWGLVSLSISRLLGWFSGWRYHLPRGWVETFSQYFLHPYPCCFLSASKLAVFYFMQGLGLQEAEIRDGLWWHQRSVPGQLSSRGGRSLSKTTSVFRAEQQV